MKTILLGLALAVSLSSAAWAQTQENQCPPTAVNCTGSNQWSGDVSTVNNSGDVSSSASQQGNSSASNASGNSFDPSFDNRTQTTQNANNTTTGTISGGNTHSQGGDAQSNGNKLDNQNNSSVGNTSSNSGGNNLSTGSNDNKVTGGNNTATNTANGGAVSGSGNSANKNSNSAQGGTAKQGQAQGQSLTNGNALAGGNNTSNTSVGGQQANTRSGVAGSGNSATVVDTGGNVHVNNTKIDARSLFIPPVVPPTPPSTLAAGNIIKETLACGPLQRVVKTPITGTVTGFFSDSHVDLGVTYDLEDFVDNDGRVLRYHEVLVPGTNMYKVYGHQAIILSTVIGVSGAKNMALGGGGGSAMNWGQVGGGSSGAMQRLVTNIQLKACEAGTGRVAPIQVNPLPVINPPRE